jgi:glyoxylase-like metal-dependent hydrolase (beta-lactamase superfamily II)
MTTEYVIHPIPLIVFETDMPKMTHLQNYGQKVDLLIYVWYVEGGSKKVCVDAGATVERLEFRGFPGGKTIQTLEQGLGRWGVKPEDIDIVIFTHLHHDHIALAPQFKNARFIAQKAELEQAPKWNNYPLYKGAFPEDMISAVKIETVEGDMPIIDGIDVLLTAGHTAGTQSVAINTSKGKAIIYGACSVLANFEPNEAAKQKGMTVIPPAIHLSVVDAYDSQDRVKKMADIVIPVHEPSFRDVPSIP